MDSAYMYHSSHYDAGVTRRIFGDVSLNCDDDIYSMLTKASARIILVG